jgi:hypothetical protein
MYNCILSVFSRLFPKQAYLGLHYSATRLFLEQNAFDMSKLYFFFDGSSGDLWFIASALPYLLASYPHAVILSQRRNSELLRIFIGSSFVANSVIYVSDENHELIKKAVFRDFRAVEAPPSASFAFMQGVIRPCHIASYPFLAELCMSGSLGYFDALRHILGVLTLNEPLKPAHYSSQDHDLLNHVSSAFTSGPKVLLNPVNFSHEPPALKSVINLLHYLHDNGISVYLNVSLSSVGNNYSALGKSDSYLCSLLEYCPFAIPLSIPLHLMALTMSAFSAVVGADGGAMAVAAGFTKTPCFILGTTSKYYHEYSRLRALRRPNPYADEFSVAARGDNYYGLLFASSDSYDSSFYPIILDMCLQDVDP